MFPRSRSASRASSPARSRATTPTSPMLAQLFSARHSAYSSRESVCQVRKRCCIVCRDVNETKFYSTCRRIVDSSNV